MRFREETSPGSHGVKQTEMEPCVFLFPSLYPAWGMVLPKSRRKDLITLKVSFPLKVPIRLRGHLGVGPGSAQGRSLKYRFTPGQAITVFK